MADGEENAILRENSRTCRAVKLGSAGLHSSPPLADMPRETGQIFPWRFRWRQTTSSAIDQRRRRARGHELRIAPGTTKEMAWLRDEAPPICPHDRLAAAAAPAKGDSRSCSSRRGITPGNSWTPPCIFRSRIGVPPFTNAARAHTHWTGRRKGRETRLNH